MINQVLRALLAVAVLMALAAMPARAQNKVDWPTYGFDNARHGYNPYETIINRDTIANLKFKWSTPMVGAILTQPLVASNVLVGNQWVDLVYAGDSGGNFSAFNAATGALVWSVHVPPTPALDCNGNAETIGFMSTPVLDRENHVIYLAAPDGNVYALDEATGATKPGWVVNVTATPSLELFWSGLTLYQGQLYVTLAGNCDRPPYKGRVVSIDTAAAAIVGTWYVTGINGPSGGGIWSWGGVSIDETTGAIFTGTGNSIGPGYDEKFLYAESVVRLDSNLEVRDADQPPLTGQDIDFGSTPMLYDPPGCPGEVALVNKSGWLLVYDRYDLYDGPIQSLLIADPSSGVSIGVAAYDPIQNRVVVTNSSASADGQFGAGVLSFPIVNCLLQSPTQVTNGYAQQNTYFPIAPPTLANGIIYTSNGAGGQFTALDASTGQLLAATPPGWVAGGVWNAPSVANGQVYLSGVGGLLYAFGL